MAVTEKIWKEKEELPREVWVDNKLNVPLAH
jgi:hypothetical protein